MRYLTRATGLRHDSRRRYSAHRRQLLFLRTGANSEGRVPPQTTEGCGSVERRKLPWRGPGTARPPTNFLCFGNFRMPLPRLESSYWQYSRSGKKWQTLNNLQVAVKHTCILSCRIVSYYRHCERRHLSLCPYLYT